MVVEPGNDAVTPTPSQPPAGDPGNREIVARILRSVQQGS